VIKKILLGFAAITLSIAVVFYWSYRNVVITVPVPDQLVALTFDDGPNPPDTQALLDLLQQHQVKATFFMKGRNVQSFPADVRAVAAAGHEIGNHSYNHPSMLWMSRSASLAEIARTNQALENILGFTPRLFRPPFGAQGPGLTLALAQLNMTSIGMSAIGSDWDVFDPQQIANNILSAIEPGAIVLLHDGHADVADPMAQDSRSATIAATQILIKQLRAQGYRFVTISELMAASIAVQ